MSEGMGTQIYLYNLAFRYPVGVWISVVLYWKLRRV